MSPKVYIVINGKPKEFVDIQEAMTYAKEHDITDIEVFNLGASQSLEPHNYMMPEPRIPTVVSMSGQENRRARRAAERNKKKK